MATGMCFDRPPHAPLSMSLLATISASWSQREIPRPPSAQCIIVKCHLNEDDKADMTFVTQECTQLDLSWRERADQSFIFIRVANLYRMLIWMSRQFRRKYHTGFSAYSWLYVGNHGARIQLNYLYLHFLSKITVNIINKLHGRRMQHTGHVNNSQILITRISAWHRISVSERNCWILTQIHRTLIIFEIICRKF